MSIDEAIRLIEIHNEIHQKKEPNAIRITEALNMAVKALKHFQIMQELSGGD